jgi:hypothetical protein
MKSLCTALLACLGTFACATPIGLDKQENTYSAMEGSHQVATDLRDARLGDIEVEDPISKRVNDQLQLDFTLTNTLNAKVKFEMQVRWFNGAGEKPFSVGPWRPTFLEAHASKAMTVVAPTTTCVGWQIATRSSHTSN